MLLCRCYPPRFGSLFKTSPLPGDDVTRPGAARLPGPAWPVAMRVTGTQDRPLLSASPPLRAPSWSPLGPEMLAAGGEEAQSGGRPVCHPEPPPAWSPKGALPTRGSGVLSLFFFSRFVLWPPAARSRGPRNWRGSGEGARLTGSIAFLEQPRQASPFCGHRVLPPSARPARARAADGGICAGSFVKKKKQTNANVFQCSKIKQKQTKHTKKKKERRRRPGEV